MADKNGKVVQPPYKCAWCGEELHDRYHKPIYTDYNDGNNFCSWYCLQTKQESELDDSEKGKEILKKIEGSNEVK